MVPFNYVYLGTSQFVRMSVVATFLLVIINGVHDPENHVPEATGVRVSSDAREPPSRPLKRHEHDRVVRVHLL